MSELFAKDAFADKVVLVTGGTSGIGAETARQFAAHGARVVISGRNAERGAGVVKEIADGGGEAAFVKGDVTDSSSCDALVAETVKRFARLDILFNNAGVVSIGKIDTFTDAEWHRIIETNLTGPFYMARAAVRQMKAQGGGAIVNMSSECGLIGYEDTAAYSTSKGGIVMLTKVMALDHAKDNIRVNAVCPGDIDTGMTDTVWATMNVSKDEIRKQLEDHIPLGRVGHVSDIARAVMYMASDAAAFMTGAMVSVDGGTTAR